MEEVIKEQINNVPLNKEKLPGSLYPIIPENELLPGEEIENNNLEDTHKVVSGDYFLTAPIKEKPFLVAGMIPEGAISILTADSGAGKSLFMLILVMHVATGRKLFDTFETKQANVLILDLEMDEDILISRHRAFISETMPIYYHHSQPFDVESDFGWLIVEITRKNIGLVVIDTISNAHIRDENSATEMKLITKKLLEIINQTKTSIIICHHHRKKMAGDKFSMGSVRGSTAIIAAVASHLLLDSKKEIDETGHIVLKMTIEQFKSRRPDGINKIGLDVIYDKETKLSTYEYLGEIDEKSISLKAAKEFLGNFMQLGTDYSVKELTAEKKAQGLKFGVNIIRDACKELVAEGLFECRKGDHGKDLYFKTF